VVRRLLIVTMFVGSLGGVTWLTLAILAMLGFHYAGVPGWVPLPA
jgi:hypothetical protein